ncbi:MAG: DUF421 domain-containing protein [Bacteroidia bacterium]
MEEKVQPFEWSRILISEETGYEYLFEVGFRSLVMFVFLLILLKFLGKRGIKQLSIFELAIVIALGSAAGDPMFYHDVALLHCFLALMIVVLVYRLLAYITGSSLQIEKFLEGKPICLLEEGRINYKNYRRERLPYDTFYSELRMKSVDQLGQVRKVYLETSGELSIYLFSNDKVKTGLPIYPEIIMYPLKSILNAGNYACIYCGNIQELARGESPKCSVCKNNKWVETSNLKRTM